MIKTTEITDKDLLMARFNEKEGKSTRTQVVVMLVLVKAGNTCWYCFRAHNVVYRPRWALGIWKEKLADRDNHPNLPEELSKYVLWLFKTVVDHIACGHS